MQVFVILSLIVAILSVVFALQNNASTTLQFLTWKFEGSLALVILFAVAAGALMSFFASLPSLLRLKWHLRNHKKRLNELTIASDKPRADPRGVDGR